MAKLKRIGTFVFIMELDEFGFIIGEFNFLIKKAEAKCFGF